MKTVLRILVSLLKRPMLLTEFPLLMDIKCFQLFGVSYPTVTDFFLSHAVLNILSSINM